MNFFFYFFSKSNGGCDAEFCWLCLEKWSTHGDRSGKNILCSENFILFIILISIILSTSVCNFFFFSPLYLIFSTFYRSFSFFIFQEDILLVIFIIKQLLTAIWKEKQNLLMKRKLLQQLVKLIVRTTRHIYFFMSPFFNIAISRNIYNMTGSSFSLTYKNKKILILWFFLHLATLFLFNN